MDTDIFHIRVSVGGGGIPTSINTRAIPTTMVLCREPTASFKDTNERYLSA
jgi:hypothetical protein